MKKKVSDPDKVTASIQLGATGKTKRYNLRAQRCNARVLLTAERVTAKEKQTEQVLDEKGHYVSKTVQNTSKGNLVEISLSPEETAKLIAQLSIALHDYLSTGGYEP